MAQTFRGNAIHHLVCSRAPSISFRKLIALQTIFLLPTQSWLQIRFLLANQEVNNSNSQSYSHRHLLIFSCDPIELTTKWERIKVLAGPAMILLWITIIKRFEGGSDDGASSHSDSLTRRRIRRALLCCGRNLEPDHLILSSRVFILNGASVDLITALAVFE